MCICPKSIKKCCNCLIKCCNRGCKMLRLFVWKQQKVTHFIDESVVIAYWVNEKVLLLIDKSVVIE